MPDSSDDFFSSFGSNSPVGPPRKGPPPGPPPQNQQQQQQNRGPPPGPPPPPYAGGGGQQRPNSNNSNYVLSSNSGSQQTAGQPAAQPTYYGNSTMQQQQQAPPPPQQQQQPSSPYPYQQQPQQQQQNDWYSPSNSNNTMMQGGGGMMMPQQQHQQQQPHSPFGNNTYGGVMEGNMDASGRSAGSGGMMMNNNNFQQQQPQPHMFIPQLQQPGLMDNNADVVDNDDVLFANEPPLLEELGVNIEHIMMKTKAVVVPFRRFQKNHSSALTEPSMIVEDADLAGPLFLAMLLGGELMMTGKLQFGYIYGFGLFGCCSMTLVLNLLSPDKPISFWTVTSILGYALLPVNLLAAMKIVLIFSIPGLTKILALVAVFWSTTASTRLLEIGCGLSAQRYLVAYPIALLYSAFVLITIF